jgi:hypothetical protein
MCSKREKVVAPIQSSIDIRGLFRRALASQSDCVEQLFAALRSTRSIQQIQLVGGPLQRRAEVALGPQDGDGYFDLMQVNGSLAVIVENFALRTPRSELLAGGNWISLHFRLSGSSTVTVNNSVTWIRFNRPGLLVHRESAGIQLTQRILCGERARGVTILLNPNYLIERFSNARSIRPELRGLLCNPITGFAFHQLPLNGLMFRIVTKFLESRYSGSLALKNAEGLALELLCTAVAGSAGSRRPRGPSAICPALTRH